jgi:hypothetical protein
MRLTSAQVERTLRQFEAHVLPDTHPAVPRLNELFGDHTFFVATNGLNVVEPTEPAPAGTEAGKVVNLADWGDASLTSLVPHEPQPTDVVIIFEPGH